MSKIVIPHRGNGWGDELSEGGISCRSRGQESRFYFLDVKLRL